MVASGTDVRLCYGCPTITGPYGGKGAVESPSGTGVILEDYVARAEVLRVLGNTRFGIKWARQSSSETDKSDEDRKVGNELRNRGETNAPKRR